MRRLILMLGLLSAAPVHAELVREGAIDLAYGVGLGAATLDASAGYAYFVDTTTNHGFLQTTQVSRIRLSDFSTSASWTDTQLLFVTPAIAAINAAVIDPGAGFAYFAYQQNYATINKVRLSDFSLQVSTPLPFGTGPFGCGIIDPANGYAYFGTQTSPARIVKVHLADLTVVGTLLLASPAAYLQSAAMDTTNHYAYFGSSTTPGQVTKINLQNFTFVQTMALSGAGGAVSAFLDAAANSVWFGTNDSPGQVIKIALDSFTQQPDTLTLQQNENNLTSVIYDPQSHKAYFGTFTSTGSVVRISPQGMKRDGIKVILAPGEDNLTAAVVDNNHYAYFGTQTNHPHIVKVDLIGGIPEVGVVPPEQSVAIGQTASFAIAATGRNLTYQWKRDGTAISGATQPLYQLPNVTLTDDGVTFTCAVTNSSGTATSGGTILTVNPDVHVFPNPWRADRHAALPVTFSNLPSGAIAQVFTLSAQWVADIPEVGNVAAWNLKNSAGQNAASGYYFYYVKNP